MLSFYIASSRDGLPLVRSLAAQLEKLDMRASFAWWDHFDHRCSLVSCGVADRAHLASCELEAAGSCRLFVGIARMGRGSHVELGAALAGRRTKIILVGMTAADSVFYAATGVEHVPTVDDVAPALKLWTPA